MKVKAFDIKLLVQIFITFFKIGPVTFGGGYAMIPLIEREVVEKRRWVKTEDVTDIFAVAESVPGAIAINSATFIGYRLAGVAGAIVAMTGVLLPTFFIVVMLSLFFLQVQDNPKVEAAFVSIRATIVALITYAAIKIGKTAIVDKTTVALIAITVAVLFFIHIHPVLIIISGGIIGIGIISLKKKLGISIKLEKEETVKPDYYLGAGI
ncbi:chromate transporter [Litchfieldia alkalitelluris]|uniref:chromate transporter n=1 Tax=Litchfieldia alkalitelluris TaxID=304268 RepID=UPI000998BDA7|nr:chromate transporter [Litchfieldia alkalitelluris]